MCHRGLKKGTPKNKSMVFITSPIRERPTLNTITARGESGWFPRLHYENPTSLIWVHFAEQPPHHNLVSPVLRYNKEDVDGNFLAAEWIISQC